ncbi:zinc finger protein 836-like [Ostrea edulis]|uniref:zinc finger protein 836-like n=1 Tax=Ostrea edulis TaxID=37623 RepID=UPI0024AEA4BA|nr:zinc finger protein 836-like [Ostrea edulis]XP_048766296.2 zinc finger protein 836-like [Ostrea edulis]
MEVGENCDVTESAAVARDTEHCSVVKATEENSNKDINGEGSRKFKEESVDEKCDDNNIGSRTYKEKCRENHRTEGRNIEFRASEGSHIVEIKSERNHSPNLFLNDGGQLDELVDLKMEVEEEEDVPQDDEKPLECEMCDEVFPSQEDLEEHLMTHAGSTLYECTVCQRRFPCAKYMMNHMKMHESKQDSHTFQCGVCREQFKQEQVLHEHMAVHSGISNCELHDENWNTGTRSMVEIPQTHQLHTIKTFKCTQCKKICLSGEELKEHKKIHETDKHPCQICGKKFSRENLITHLVQHSRDLAYLCRVCKLVFTEKSHLDNHIQSKHCVDAIMLCGFCKNSCFRRSDLEKHLKSHVKKVYKLRETTGEPYSLRTSMQRFFACELCEENFLTELQLLVHMKNHCIENILSHHNSVPINNKEAHSTSEVPHLAQSAVDKQPNTQSMVLKLVKQSTPLPASILVPKEVNQNSVKTGPSLRIANLNQTDEMSQTTLLKVVNSGSGKVLVPVPNKNKMHSSEKQDKGMSDLTIDRSLSSQQPAMLIYQVNKYDTPVDFDSSFHSAVQNFLTNPNPQQLEADEDIPLPSLNYECNMCEKDLHTTGRLYEHIVEHNHYICSCGDHLDATSALYKHIYHHKKKHIHQCEVCGKTFHRLSRLKPHLKAHNREYKCEECGKTFSWSNCLRKHMLIHKGEKSFICVKCGMAFNVQSALTRHEKTHTDQKPFQCNVCEKRFRVRDNLHVHMRVHTGEKPYQCERCGQAFNHNVSLKTHLKKYHSEDM